MMNNASVTAQKNPYAKDQEQMYEEFLALYNQLSVLPLRQPGSVNAFGWKIEYVSGPAVLANLQYQVIKRINDFFPDNDSPVILDLGANIGFSVLNYKRQYPGAKITAFEPDPVFVPILRRNLANNGAEDVEVVEAAAWITNGKADWASEGIDGSRLINSANGKTAALSVQTVDIGQYLDREIDLVKMDIEGAEFAVIPHLAGKLGRVKNLSIECHVKPDLIGQFAELLKILVDAGFSVWVNSYSEWQDLIRIKEILPDHFGQYFVVAATRQKLTSRPLSWGVSPDANLGNITDLWQRDKSLQQTNNLYHQLYDQHQQLWKKYEESQAVNSDLQKKYEETQAANNTLRKRYEEGQQVIQAYQRSLCARIMRKLRKGG